MQLTELADLTRERDQVPRLTAAEKNIYVIELLCIQQLLPALFPLLGVFASRRVCDETEVRMT